MIKYIEDLKNMDNWELPRKRKIFWSFTFIWILFVYLINGEWLYFMPFILGDILFWKTINYTFWKKRKNKVLKKKRSSWVDAIIFAVIAATLIRTFFIEAYTIPTPSMEKSLMVGDYLFVSKTSYGPRVPITPLSFPLVHHTLPITGGKSYLEWLKIPYHRMSGLNDSNEQSPIGVERNDCVVFNWPAETLGRPIDKKENYVKRCVGMPGDKIEIVDGILKVNDQFSTKSDGIKKQWHYKVQTKGSGLNPKILYEKYDITEGGYGKNRNEYILTLTEENAIAIKGFSNVISLKKKLDKKSIYKEYIFPNNKKYKWNADQYGPIVIPKKGDSIKLNLTNINLYKDIIERYENNILKVIDDKILINNKVAEQYIFKMNYYWMMGDNHHNSADSRFWGFVPENHIVGKALFIWMSWDKNAKGINKIRWDRLFKSVK